MATANYTGARYDVRIVKGDDVSETFSFRDSDGEPLDLDGYTFESQIRATPDGPAVGTFNCSVEDNTATRTLSNTVTAGLEGTYYHDMQWTDPGGLIRTLVQGRFVVVPEITRV